MHRYLAAPAEMPSHSRPVPTRRARPTPPTRPEWGRASLRCGT